MNNSLNEFMDNFLNEIKNANVCLDFRRRGSVGSHILRNNNLAQDALNGSGMSSGIDRTSSFHNNLLCSFTCLSLDGMMVGVWGKAKE